MYVSIIQCMMAVLIGDLNNRSEVLYTHVVCLVT